MTREAWSRTPAGTWDAGTVVGTGVVGGVLYGDPARHVLVLSHEQFFLPVNSRRAAPELADILPMMRELLALGDEVGAANLVDERLRGQDWDPDTLIWTDPLAPVAQLVWETGEEGWSDYRRHLPLDDIGGAVSWSTPASGRRGIRISARHGDAGFDIELWSETATQGIISLEPVTERAAGASTVVPVDYGDSVSSTGDRSETTLALSSQVGGVERGTDAWASVVVRGDSAMETAQGGWRVRVPAGGRVHLRIDIAFGRADVEDDQTPADVWSLDAPALLGRSELWLHGTVNSDNNAVEDIWDAARAGEAGAEASMFEVAYAAGRRNILASTGCLPPTLQGVWQGTWAPAWSADYTMNGNVQLGALAGALWTGTPELMRSLFRLVRRYADDYRSNARRIFGIEGMLLPARLTTHGHANHFLRDYPHQFWLGNGPWLLRLAVDYIQVTGDRTPIDEWLWEFATEVLDFSAGVLRDAGGMISPSYSPENTPAGRDNPLATDAAADIAALRDGFQAGAWLAELVGETSRAAAWQALRDTLPNFRVADDGTLAEWGAGWSENIAHRHVSQLQGLWYEPDPRLTSGPLRDAALQTIRAKIAWRAEDPSGPPGRMEMAFGLTSLGLAAAALGDADAAYQCAVWLARDHFTSALTTTHDAGAIFNVDAAGALPALVAAMLVGSAPGRLRLLPAAPRHWGHGSVTGLGTRAGIRLASLDWHPDGLRFSTDASAGRSSSLAAEVAVELPRAAVLVESVGVRQTGPRSLLLASGDGQVSAALAYAER